MPHVSTRPIKGSSPGDFLAYLQASDTSLSYYDGVDGFERCWGGLARELGYENGITSEQWSQAYLGLIDGERVTKKTDSRIAMQDVTVSFEKSIGELFVASTPEERQVLLEQVIWPSLEVGARYMEETTNAVKIQRKVYAGGDRYETVRRRYPARMLITPALQFAARETPATIARGAPPDVSIHCHMAVMNLMLCEDGKYRSGDSWGFKVNAEHIAQAISNEATRRLEALGYEIIYSDIDFSRNSKIRWELADSSREARDHWSSNLRRRWEIEKAYEEKFGKPITDEYARHLMYLTRERKVDKETDTHGAWERWRKDAEENGIKLGEFLHEHPIHHDPYVDQAELWRRLTGPSGLIREGATFDEPTIGQAVRRCAVGLGFSPEELAGFEAIVRNEKELVPVRDGQHPEDRLYTTRTLLDAERRISIARQMRGDRWVDITGPAGTGKSTMAAAAVKLLRGQNPDLSKLNDGQRAGVSAITYGGPVDQVICVSTAATAAEETGLKIRADHYGSFESVVTRLERRTLRTSPRTLIVVEEAGMVDTLRMDRLLKAAGDARIATLGDDRQLSPIGAAGWYQDNIEQHGSIELTEVRRQVDPDDVRDLDLIRTGRATEGVAGLAARGRVHETRTDADRIAQVLTAYQAHRDAGRSAADVRIVMDTSNREGVDVANRFIQRTRVERREIGQNALDVYSEKLDRRWSLHENDQVITVAAYRPPGEQDAIKNGSKGVVRSIKAQEREGRIEHVCRVRFEDGSESLVPAEVVMPSYAIHINKMQGGEAAIVLGVPGREQTNREAGYTIASRGVEEIHLFVSQESNGGVKGLGTQWERSATQESASKQVARLRAEEVTQETDRDITDDIGLPRGIRPRSTSLADDFAPDPEEVRRKIEQEGERDRGWER